MKRQLAILLACTLLMGLARSVLVAETEADPPPPNQRKSEVQVKRDIAYFEGEGADRFKHKLDLYLPKGKSGFPVVLFVHGGALMTGDRNFFGVYEAVGKMFARNGIGAVVTSYRLSPGVLHPEHIKDVARAVAWTHNNIHKYGGRTDQIFVCGHSAGGHLISLLATDESYLKAEGLSLKDIKGAMPISGVYAIPNNLFNEVFGKDLEIRKKAGPLSQVCAECPPFLIVYADKDFPWCDKVSEEFAKALKAEKVPAETLSIKNRNHLDIIMKTAADADPCGQALLDFIAKHAE